MYDLKTAREQDLTQIYELYKGLTGILEIGLKRPSVIWQAAFLLDKKSCQKC